MGCHGTKIIVFNLWLNDASEMELDFTTDDEVGFVLSATPLHRFRISVFLVFMMYFKTKDKHYLVHAILQKYLMQKLNIFIEAVVFAFKNIILLPLCYWKINKIFTFYMYHLIAPVGLQIVEEIDSVHVEPLILITEPLVITIVTCSPIYCFHAVQK